MPDQTDRRVVLTGVTGPDGRAYDVTARTALELTRHGAEVVLAGSDPGAIQTLMARVRAEVPTAVLSPLQVELSDVSSVRRAAEQVPGPVDVLVLDAAGPSGRHGAFAFTGLLFERLVASGDGRVVIVLGGVRPPFRGSAALLLVVELDRRTRTHGVPVKAIAAHPGWITSSGPATILDAVRAVAGQPVALSAVPVLMAATAALPGASYVVPDGPLGLKGSPRVLIPRTDPDEQRRAWEAAERATGVRFLDA